MTEPLHVRTMLAEDLDSVMENERAAYEIPWTEHVFAESLEGRNDCLVLLKHGCIIGHAVVSRVVDEFHLLNLCVAPKCTGQGLGRYLLRHLIEWAADIGSSVFFLEVRASNAAAISLYHSEGFNEVGLRPNYYPALKGREDAVLMTLQLAPLS